MITRRNFLRTAAITGVPLIAGAVFWRDSAEWVLSRSRARLSAIVHGPAEQLRAHFDYLDLDPEGVAKFFDDCQRHGRGASRWFPLHSDLYMRYLLSTDFFQHRADESRRIQYIGLFDPAVTPCNNPLATFDEET